MAKKLDDVIKGLPPISSKKSRPKPRVLSTKK